MQPEQERPILHRGIPATLEVECLHSSGEDLFTLPHVHSKIELLYCVQGKWLAKLNGREYRFGPGDLLFINSWEIHTTTSLDPGENIYWVVKIPTDFLYNSSSSVFESQYAAPFLFQNDAHPRVLTAAEQAGSPVPACLEEICREWEGQSYGYELAARAALFRIFAWSLRHWRQQGYLPDQENDPGLFHLQPALEYMDAHFAEPIELQDMARLCHISSSYFSHQFHKSVGSTFSAYLNARRLAEAERLLGTTNYNINEISLRVGFSNAGYFIQKFKQVKGISPRKFRENYLAQQKEIR